MNPLLANVAELLRHPGTRRAVRVEVPSDGLCVVDTTVAEGTPIDVDVELESLTDGIVVTGRVSARWEAVCRRCLGPVEGLVDVFVRELYQARPESDEAFAIQNDVLDLEPLVREAVLLDLPLAPLCRPDCAGLCPECGADLNAADCGHRRGDTDARWAALDDLRERLDRPSN
jgi:uncharacterized protein